MGWRALRLALERDGLLKVQARALLEAAAGHTLNVMFPMVSEPWEFDAAKAVFDSQLKYLKGQKKLAKLIEKGRDLTSDKKMKKLIEDIDDLACVIVPLGGGGLISGAAIAVKSMRPDVRVIGVQAAVCAPYAGGTPADGPVLTLADGIAYVAKNLCFPQAGGSFEEGMGA